MPTTLTKHPTEAPTFTGTRFAVVTCDLYADQWKPQHASDVPPPQVEIDAECDYDDATPFVISRAEATARAAAFNRRQLAGLDDAAGFQWAIAVELAEPPQHCTVTFSIGGSGGQFTRLAEQQLRIVRPTAESH